MNQSSTELIEVVGRLLGELVRSDAFERGDVSVALAQLTEASATAIGVERASVWRFGEDRRSIRCLDLFEKTARRHGGGQVLTAENAPAYFAALDADLTIAAHDARTDPRTSEFNAAYLVPNGIGAMLDAPIVIGKSHVGVVCHEHVGGPRTWTAFEQLVAATFADFAVMLFGAEERGRQARALDAYRTQLEELVERRTRELRESEEAFRQTFEGAPVALTVARLADHRVTAANDRAAELFGYASPEAMIGSYAPHYWVDPADRTRLLAQAESEGTVDVLGRLQKVDGKPFWADVAVHLVTRGGERSLLFGIRDVTVQQELEQRLRELATTDELTGVLNRRRLFEIGGEELERAARYGRPLSLCMLDLDHFKQINDAFGHQAGDATLRRVATTIGDTIRKQDRLGRYGGEEFVVLFPETRVEAALVVAQRARGAVEALGPAPETPGRRITVSAGVVELSGGEPLETLLRRADEALYEAKATGRNRVVAR
jgi:diguanylate cyclase (GGDEF)-like protein/PAS domain S-box-containing protein